MTRWLLCSSVAVLVLGFAVLRACGQTTAPEAGAGGDAAVAKPSVHFVEPEPAVVPVSWQLDIKVSKPTRIVITPTGNKDPVYYWIIIYTVSNPTNKAQDFLPRITLMTDTLETVDAQMAISPDLFKTIKEVTKAKYLEEPIQVTRVLGGADNARDSVAVFPLKGDPKWFRVFFCGFSGEQWPMKTPGGDVTMEKVRTMEFSVPGNTPPEQVPPVELKPGSDKWTMRAMPPQTRYEIDLNRIRKGLDPIYVAGSVPKPTAPTTKPEGAE
ncbi:MAG: hypothetical protein PHU85_14855 [Phycisphaerae bacterium]|nr:hypothetical protein [Phycisphaerae bacterium]